MARPIEKTPMITGEDAQRFRESLLKSLTLSFPHEEIERQKQELQEMKKFYQQFIAAANISNGRCLEPYGNNTFL